MSSIARVFAVNPCPNLVAFEVVGHGFTIAEIMDGSVMEVGEIVSLKSIFELGPQTYINLTKGTSHRLNIHEHHISEGNVMQRIFQEAHPTPTGFIKKFVAYDREGKQYELRAVLTDGSLRRIDGPTSKSPERVIWTTDGTRVRWLQRGKYEIDGPAVVPLISDDPYAV